MNIGKTTLNFFSTLKKLEYINDNKNYEFYQKALKEYYDVELGKKNKSTKFTKIQGDI